MLKIQLEIAHIKRDWALATAEVSADGRLVQRSFWRAFRRNAEGDINESLIPESLVAWYADSDDEKTPWKKLKMMLKSPEIWAFSRFCR